MFTRLDYSSALEYIIIRRYTNIVYCILYIVYCILYCILYNTSRCGLRGTSYMWLTCCKMVHTYQHVSTPRIGGSTGRPMFLQMTASHKSEGPQNKLKSDHAHPLPQSAPSAQEKHIHSILIFNSTKITTKLTVLDM